MTTFQPGLTTTELIVTLFVGALFIMSGYQLYGAVNLQAGNAREMAEASNIGYRILRNQGSVYPSSPPPLCTATPSSETIASAIIGSTSLPNPSGTIIRCKPYADSDVVRVMVEIAYGDPQRKAVHATYVSP